MTSAARPNPADLLWTEMERELLVDTDVSLERPAIDAFHELYQSTVGRYLACQHVGGDPDFVDSARFRRYIMMCVNVIAFELLTKHEGKVGPHQMIELVEDVMRRAPTRYTTSLPLCVDDVPLERTHRVRFRCPMCFARFARSAQ